MTAVFWKKIKDEKPPCSVDILVKLKTGDVREAYYIKLNPQFHTKAKGDVFHIFALNKSVPENEVLYWRYKPDVKETTTKAMHKHGIDILETITKKRHGED